MLRDVKMSVVVGRTMSIKCEAEFETTMSSEASVFADEMRNGLLPFVNNFINMRVKDRQQFKGHYSISRLYALCRISYRSIYDFSILRKLIPFSHKLT